MAYFIPYAKILKIDHFRFVPLKIFNLKVKFEYQWRFKWKKYPLNCLAMSYFISTVYGMLCYLVTFYISEREIKKSNLFISLHICTVSKNVFTDFLIKFNFLCNLPKIPTFFKKIIIILKVLRIWIFFNGVANCSRSLIK